MSQSYTPEFKKENRSPSYRRGTYLQNHPCRGWGYKPLPPIGLLFFKIRIQKKKPHIRLIILILDLEKKTSVSVRNWKKQKRRISS